jgi:hypothetical protein
VAILPDIVTAVFPDYEQAAVFAVPYMTAMALLAVSRVLAAYFSATGHPRAVTGLVGSAVALHVVLLVAMGSSTGGVVQATLFANLVLVILASARAVIGWGDRPGPQVPGPPGDKAETVAVMSDDSRGGGHAEEHRPEGDPDQHA